MDVLSNEELTQIVRRLSSTIEGLSRENGELKRRLRNVERGSNAVIPVVVQTPGQLPATGVPGIEYWVLSDGSRRWFGAGAWHSVS